MVVILIFGAEAHVGLQEGGLFHEIFPVAVDLFPQEVVSGQAGAVAGGITGRQMCTGVLVHHGEFGNVLLDGLVPLQQAVIHALGSQHDRPGLGGGSHVEQGVLGHGQLVLPVGVAVFIGVSDLAVFDDIDHAAHQTGLVGDAGKSLVQCGSQQFFRHIGILLMI